MKRIVLCADDYGQNSAISQAIVELLQVKNLSAVSCLVTSEEWPVLAKKLDPFLESADIGLHFNLTEGKLLSSEFANPIPLNDLIIKSHLHQLDKRAIAAELRAQLDKFISTFNMLPAFIDGHQHVHQLPQIRDVLFDVYEERLRAHGSYVRCTFAPTALFRFTDVAYLKQLIIQLCGGILFKQEVMKRKIPHNQTFAGIYDFKKSYNYATYFARFIKQIDDGGMIMCHPGMMGSSQDVIIDARHNEYIYFSSPQFMSQLKENNITLTRFNEFLKK